MEGSGDDDIPVASKRPRLGTADCGSPPMKRQNVAENIHECCGSESALKGKLSESIYAMWFILYIHDYMLAVMVPM